MHEVAEMRLANPASQHREGARARRLLEQYRLSILQMLGAKTDGMDSDRLLLTSGGTESNNLAIFGLARPGTRVLMSAIEHPSVTTAGQYLASGGYQQNRQQHTDSLVNSFSTSGVPNSNFDVRAIPVDHDGVIRLNRLEELLKEAPTSLVCLMAANNETGVIQPFEEACGLARQYGALIHCDAVQWVGKRPCEFQKWGLDSLSLSGHKFHGPVGIGGLVLRSGVSLQPMLFGGFQQDGLRPGTESVMLAAGIAEALSLSLAFEYGLLDGMRREMEQRLLALGPEISINGAAAARLPHTSNVALGNLDRQAFLLAADMKGLCLSAGSACASGSSEPSPVLEAMGASKQVLNSSIRISLGRDTTPEQMADATDRICKIYANLQK